MRKNVLFQARERLEKIMLLKWCSTKMQKGNKERFYLLCSHCTSLVFYHVHTCKLNSDLMMHMRKGVCCFVQQSLVWFVCQMSFSVEEHFTVLTCCYLNGWRVWSLLTRFSLCNGVYCNSLRRWKRKALWWIFKHTVWMNILFVLFSFIF